MGKLKAFMEVPRLEAGYRPLHERIHDFGEVEQTLNSRDRMAQASRCMDCGVPFCHWACPLGNKDPEWNDALCKGDWELAYRLLNATKRLPRIYRPHLSCALRKGLRAQSYRSCSGHQPRERGCHYRDSMARGLYKADDLPA